MLAAAASCKQALRLLLAAASSAGARQQRGASRHAAALSTAAAAGGAGAGDATGGADGDAAAAAGEALQPFDAALFATPLRVHELIGDPRTGVADDTTTAPFGEDVSVEWVWSTPASGVDWFRYSLAGHDARPYMYMDSRLSDHSKNLMYLLRLKDPQRWTIPALAEKFRVRRQRVMAILALKELQAHRIDQGLDMAGPLSTYVFRVPLADVQLQPDGQLVDLAQLVAAQQQAGAGAPAAARSARGGAGLGAQPAAAQGLGSLQDFLASEEDGGAAEQGAQQQAEPAEQQRQQQQQQEAAADLALLMPQVALTSQQLQLQLLRLLQRHHYSCEELQRRLLQQVDAAEAYFNTHVAGTPLEQQLLHAAEPAATAGGAAPEEGEAGEDAEAEAEAEAAPQRPAWLDFEAQRQHIKQLVALLEPLLANAGPRQDREAGQLLASLTHALQQLPAAGAPVAAGEAQQEQPGLGDSGAAADLQALVRAAGAAPLARAFNRLELAQRQQLLELVPDARVKLNIQGTDLHAALASSSSSDGSGSSELADSDGGGGSGSGIGSFSAPQPWPGAVPTLVDVWGFEELPRQALAELQEQLPGVQQLLAGLDAACGGGSSAAAVSADDLGQVQDAVQLYSGLLWEYEKVLNAQAAAAVGEESAPPRPPPAQRRLARLLRELDPAALDKLLYWESYFKETAAAAGRPQRRATARRLNRLKARVMRAIRALDDATVSAGGRGAYADYPDLPPEVPPHERADRDLMAAHLDALVVGRQFHRGSGDAHYVRVTTRPAFEGYSLQEFDHVAEGELSALTRLGTEREDALMWREFRESLLRNMGLLAPNLAQHLTRVKPPKPEAGWSWVVHPVGGAARAATRRQLARQRAEQWLPEEQLAAQAAAAMGDGSPGDLVGLAAGAAAAAMAARPPADPARGASPAAPYVAEPGRGFRALNEDEAVLLSDSVPRPRRRWYVSARSRS